MSRENGNAEWIRRGRQRPAVAQVLRKPMTTSEICTAARRISPQIQLRDIWLILQEMGERGLVICLNPRHVTGKLYALTLRGRRMVNLAFGLHVGPIPVDVDWRKYAQVVRAKVRRMVLSELSIEDAAGRTATELRKRFRDRHPIGLNPTLRALKDLERLGLVHSTREDCRVYRLTPSGTRLVSQMSR